MSPEQPPGWYPDPNGQRAVRWWDGQRWTSDARPAHREPAHREPAQGHAQAYKPTQQARPAGPPSGQGWPGSHPGQPGAHRQGPFPGQPGAYGQETQAAYRQPGGAQRHNPSLLAGNSQYGGPLNGGRPRGRQPKRPWLARNKTVVAGIGGAIGLVVLIAAFSTKGSAQSPTTEPSAVGAVVSPVAVAASSPSASPKPAAHTVATYHGTGTLDTPDFTVTSDWKLSYSFSCAALGEASGFAVLEDGGQDTTGVRVSDLAESKSSSASARNDAGQHYLEVSTACSWKLEVIDEP